MSDKEDDNVKEIEIPKIMTEKEKDFREHLDINNKIDCTVLQINWENGVNIIPTKIRIDKNLIDIEQVPDDLKKESEFQFARCIWGNLQWSDKDIIKTKMLKDIQKLFNKEIVDMHIFSKGHIHEKDTVIITNNLNDSPIVWIKFLRNVISDTVWKDFQGKSSRKGFCYYELIQIFKLGKHSLCT